MLQNDNRLRSGLIRHFNDGGADGRIYAPVFGKNYLNVIDTPNAPGVAAGFCENGVSLGEGIGQNGLPNYPNAFPAHRWTGSVSSAYTEAGNRSKKTVPAANDAVFIPAGAARMPVLTAAAARNFTVEAGATLTDNGTLTVLGNLGTPGSAPEPDPATTRINVAAYRYAADCKAGWSLPAAPAIPLVSGVGYAVQGHPPR
ncbi:hypothetical protein GCM10022408_04450 [Hymenobacter fastidiosus]|uniref:Uncharacterized protein n=1 Tax=Hymenobacter fastidiosus TaxID=486264 RepID=A0ABP7RG12_9BACT